MKEKALNYHRIENKSIVKHYFRNYFLRIKKCQIVKKSVNMKFPFFAFFLIFSSLLNQVLLLVTLSKLINQLNQPPKGNQVIDCYCRLSCIDKNTINNT